MPWKSKCQKNTMVWKSKCTPFDFKGPKNARNRGYKSIKDFVAQEQHITIANRKLETIPDNFLRSHIWFPKMIQKNPFPCCSELGQPFWFMFCLWWETSRTNQNQVLHMFRMLYKEQIKWSVWKRIWKEDQLNLKKNYLQSIFCCNISSKRMSKQNKLVEIFGFTPFLKRIYEPCLSFWKVGSGDETLERLQIIIKK